MKIESWTLATDSRHRSEVVTRWWARCSPLQRTAVAPGVIDPNQWGFTSNPNVDHKRNHGSSEKNSADRRDFVHESKSIRWQIIRIATRESLNTQPVLDQEGEMKSKKRHPEMNLSESLIEHSAGHLWPPEIETGEH